MLLLDFREIQHYQINFNKSTLTTIIFKIYLPNDMISKPKLIWNLTKRAVEKGDLDEFWKRTNALNPNNLTKMLYSESVVRCLRNALKEQTGIYFQMDEVAASLFHIITEKIEFSRPKLKTKKLIAPKAEAIVDKIA